MKELIEQIEKILDELTIESYYSESLHENDYMITGKAKCAEAIVKLLLPGPGAEQALTKYDSIGKIFRQLKSCNYENEAGPLDNNVAFIALERMASLAPVPAMERERIIEIFKNEFGHQPTISNKFRLQGIEWLFSKLAPEKPAEVIKENDPNVKLAAGLFKSQSPAEVSDKAKVYYCTICGKNPVDAENGYDTCSECLSRM